MWTQTISIYGKNVGTKSNQKLLITILNNDFLGWITMKMIR